MISFTWDIKLKVTRLASFYSSLRITEIGEDPCMTMNSLISVGKGIVHMVVCLSQ